MKLPWNRETEKEVEELENVVEEKEEEIEKLENMLEAEKQRRKKHTREKQEAEEKINRLQDKLEGLQTSKKDEKELKNIKREEIGLNQFKQSLKKLDSIVSDEKELVTIYSPQKLSDHPKIDSIKNSIPEKELNPLINEENLLIFYDPDLGLYCFRTRPFFEEKVVIDNEFSVDSLINFIESSKTWILVSRGDTKILTEEDGNLEEKNHLKSRVNGQHGKGGFSQGRFERKRDEQIDQHLEEVSESLENFENTFLLGERRLCKDLQGRWLGGFDPNSSELSSFYQVQRLKNITDD